VGPATRLRAAAPLGLGAAGDAGDRSTTALVDPQRPDSTADADRAHCGVSSGTFRASGRARRGQGRDRGGGGDGYAEPMVRQGASFPYLSSARWAERVL